MCGLNALLQGLSFGLQLFNEQTNLLWLGLGLIFSAEIEKISKPFFVMDMEGFMNRSLL